MFNTAVSNTGDPLRNHDFSLTNKGWRLSPLFDVIPVPYVDCLSLNITEYDNALDPTLAFEAAPQFDLTRKAAEKYAETICDTVQRNWIYWAEHAGLGRSAIEMMRPAFSLKL